MERGPLGGRGLNASGTGDLDDLLSELGVVVPIRHAVAAVVSGPPTLVQAAALSDATAGHDLLVVAPTGSGKTLVFGVAIAHQLMGAPSLISRPRALVIAPTRELAEQNAEVVAGVGAGVGLRVATFVGGQPVSRDRRVLAAPVDVAVGTPGRLSDLVQRGVLSTADVRVLVLDEADQLLDASFAEQTSALLDHCAGAVLLGATATAGHDLEQTLRGRRSSIRIHRLSSPVATPGPSGHARTGAPHRLVVVPVANPEAFAVTLAARCRRALFFVPRRDAVESLRSAIAATGIPAGGVVGSASPTARSAAFSDLASGRVRVLVSTDLAGRGLDLEAIGHVIHVGPPHSVDDLIHRSGRTGRGDATPGVVAAVVRPFEVDRVRAQAGEARMAVDVVDPAARGPRGLDAVFGPEITVPRRRRDPAPRERTRRPSRSRVHRPKRKRK